MLLDQLLGQINVCADKSMDASGVDVCPQKPHPMGNEYHLICCGISGIMYSLRWSRARIARDRFRLQSIMGLEKLWASSCASWRCREQMTGTFVCSRLCRHSWKWMHNWLMPISLQTSPWLRFNSKESSQKSSLITRIKLPLQLFSLPDFSTRPEGGIERALDEF
jgi:hypothetical protein